MGVDTITIGQATDETNRLRNELERKVKQMYVQDKDIAGMKGKLHDIELKYESANFETSRLESEMDQLRSNELAMDETRLELVAMKVSLARHASEVKSVRGETTMQDIERQNLEEQVQKLSAQFNAADLRSKENW